MSATIVQLLRERRGEFQGRQASVKYQACTQNQIVLGELPPFPSTSRAHTRAHARICINAANSPPRRVCRIRECVARACYTPGAKSTRNHPNRHTAGFRREIGSFGRVDFTLFARLFRLFRYYRLAVGPVFADFPFASHR